MSKSSYRIAVNVEWTSKCNARCAMCPRTMISEPKLMALSTYEQVLSRLTAEDVFRVIIAGYGEPTTHPKFDDFVAAMQSRHLQFDMATNGSLLDQGRLERMDGIFTKLMISFSSTDPEVYQAVHTNLDQQQVMDNILLAHRTLKKTKLIINLSPTPECLLTLDNTIQWFHENGIRDLHMSPTYYDRAGAMNTRGMPSEKDLRAKIREHRLTSQEMGFIAGVSDFAGQWRSNRFKCIPRNTNMLINAQGYYTFCFNDIRHSHSIGHVASLSLRQALKVREAKEADAAICDSCNLRGRYRPRELTRIAFAYAKARLAAA